LEDKPGLALALSLQGDFETNYAQGQALLEEALKLSREIGDHWLTSGILNSRASLFFYQNDLTSAKSFFEQSLQESRSSGDKRRINFGLGELGYIALAQGDAVQAEKFFRESVVEAQAIRDNPNIFGFGVGIALTKLFLEDFAGAQERILEDFKFAQISKVYMSWAFLYSTWIDLAQGDLPNAAEQIKEGLLLAKQTTDSYTIGDLIFWAGEVSRRKGDFAEAKIRFEEALATYQKENLAYGCCNYFDGLGMLAIDQGQAAKGAHLFGARERLRASEFVMDFLPFMVREREAHIAAAREQLGEGEFNQAWAEGNAMSTEEAVKYALEESVEIPESKPYQKTLSSRREG
jgi:tetratricopeptide (TPR) repeat protein